MQPLSEKRFRDTMAPTKITIWKNVKEYKTEKSSLNLNKNRASRGRAERTQENIIHLQEKFVEEVATPSSA